MSLVKHVNPGTMSYETRIGVISVDQPLMPEEIERIVAIMEVNPEHAVIQARLSTMKDSDGNYCDDRITVTTPNSDMAFIIGARRVPNLAPDDDPEAVAP